MTADLDHKLANLRDVIRSCGSALVAYSGGVDSALVMLVCHQELGPKSLACIGVSPSYPQRELRDATELAEKIGVPYRLIETREHTIADYSANPANRCYFCKTELYDRLRQLAAAEGWSTIFDGSHLDDLSDHTAGMTAAREHGVRSPLLEARIRKSEIRELARDLGLPVWDKPAMACLSSRVPHGTPITPELLRRIEAAEDVLVNLGFRQFRVRHHGDLARIELPADELSKAIELRDQVLAGICAVGYRHVTLDLSGFRQTADLVPLRIGRVSDSAIAPAPSQSA